MKSNRTIGIVKEVYSKWERRSPFTPAHVKQLVEKENVRVLIQPSPKRVFSDQEFVRAGAVLSEDLTDASVIFGVKQVPEQDLIPERTYVFFSHTIKAQPENMPLLDQLLKKKIRMIDYECITTTGSRASPRMVAFGGHAGKAGMIDAIRGLGERMLSHGISNPFLNVGSAYMYPSFDKACEAVHDAGVAYSKQFASQPPSPLFDPLTFVFTGNGNVSKGAQEVFKHLPHEMVSPSDLSVLAKEGGDPSKVYGCLVGGEYIAHNIQASEAGDVANLYNREEYYSKPELYKPVFHELIAPYTSVLVNGIYWDPRFPRLISNKQLAEMHDNKQHKLQLVADVTCDIKGSVEFLNRSCAIEEPFYSVSRANIEEVNPDASAVNDSIMMMGVDILPSELAAEASSHFGECMLPFVNDLVSTDSVTSVETQRNTLPPSLFGACITVDGKLTPDFSSIEKMRRQNERNQMPELTMAEIQSLEGSCVLNVTGHLFDTGLINQMLDVVEAANGRFHMVDTIVRPNPDNNAVQSSVMLQITVDQGRGELDTLLANIRDLAQSVPDAEANIVEMSDEFCAGDFSATLHGDLHMNAREHTKDSAAFSFRGPNAEDSAIPAAKRVVLLGAGMVAGPAVEYLSRDKSVEVVVVSGVPNEAQALADKVGRVNVVPVTQPISQDCHDIDSFIPSADVVISLLPQTMHTNVAMLCVKHSVPLVTASYVSPEMRKLDEDAKKSGIPIMCEMGLDPGMDHMSAMKVIDEVKSLGGKVKKFSSLCGGLPAPEAANNPLGYKFSWSPRGVLIAMENTAKYLKEGKPVEVSPDKLLAHAEPVDLGLPAFSLEKLPNRNSIPYGELYGIDEAEYVFRGTLRYKGFSKQMQQFKEAGLFNGEQRTDLPATWAELAKELKLEDKDLSFETRRCMKWLGLFDESAPVTQSTIIDSLCDRLSEKLAYGPTERDMALMQHDFLVERADGKEEKRTSSLIVFGDLQTGTAMAKTVGVTAGIGAKLILDGKIDQTGVFIPTEPRVYNPCLDLLEKEGWVFTETQEVL